MEARPTPLEIIRNMRDKNFREEVILEEVEKELKRLQSPSTEVKGQQGVEGAKEFLQEKIKNGGWTKLNRLPFSLYEAVSIVMQEYAAIRFKEMTARCNNYFEEVAELKATIQAKSAINKIHANDIERLQSECEYFKNLYEETVKKLEIKFPDNRPSQPQEGQDELATELVRMVINSPSYPDMLINVKQNFTLIKK